MFVVFKKMLNNVAVALCNVPLNACNYTTVLLATTNAAKKKKKAKGGILSIQESVKAANILPIDIDALSEDILISGCVYLPLPPYLQCVVLMFFTWQCSSTRCCEVCVEPLILFSSGGHSPFPLLFLASPPPISPQF